ncbi:MAG: D-alanyl-D-alanine dipeptidase [Burkholderiales bacterium]|jgi:D-alanyl-D-alanine dipeptidase|nr:D-alanyl-D-alanine dipeptidase [Burkholderiales bacterium]
MLGLVKMRNKIVLLIYAISTGYYAIADNSIKIEKNRPDNFVNLKQFMPEIQTDIRYFTNHNFVGKAIDSYKAPICLLTKPAATALKTAENHLLKMGLTFKVYDCYRPQTAVNNFYAWAKQINNTNMQTEFYPAVNKADLFSKGYISYSSGHSRGSTLDLTIVPINSKIPPYNPDLKQVDCTAPQESRSPDNSLDFGTGFDCFSPVAHPNYQQLSPQVKANRLLLQIIMMQAGFKPLDTEWWHFTLVNEPYPNTYFDFPVTE